VNQVLPLVLPLSLGAAVSPTLLTIVLLILAGKVDRKPRAWAFTLGVGVVAVGAIVLFATVWSRVKLGSSHPSDSSRIIHGLLAATLVALGIHALVRKEPNGPHPSRAKQRMADARPRMFFGIGAVAMASNFSSLVLMVAATHEITKDLHGADQLPLLTFLFLCAWAPVLVPTLSTTLMGPRADPALDRLNRFTTAHSRQINAGICFLFAVILGYGAVK
jgi:Na+/melibiose symporter-like transporter